MIAASRSETRHHRPVTQRLECCLYTAKVGGSNPLGSIHNREVTQLGRVLALGARSRRFKSCFPDFNYQNGACKMIGNVDVIYGLAWGDEGKGKIANAMAKDYDMVCRWNGGPNAGHTVYIDGKKFKTHSVPSGIFAGKKCIIGPGCVINVNKLFGEIDYLKSAGFDTSLIKVSPKAHIITEKHIEEDLGLLKQKLGTTGQGIAPCYADKMRRCGVMAGEKLDKDMIWDGKLEGDILCEGAQSVWLDIDHGDYPYVTSSTTMPYGACSLGFSPKKIRKLFGVAKIYDTKSGVDPLFPESLWQDPVLNSIIDEGAEYGSTTGRKRLVNWLDMDKLIESIVISGCTDLIVNKCDVLEKVGVFKLKFESKIHEYASMPDMQKAIRYILKCKACYMSIMFSSNKELI
jgi:adenylosuccinate synthase